MMVLPELPISLLVQDYFRGKRSQQFLDVNGVHQYEKRLDQIRKMQQMAADLKREYFRKNAQGSNSVKFINTHLLAIFGKQFEASYSEFEDKFVC